MDWGDKEEWLVAESERRGKLMPALARKPEVPSHLRFVQDAFSVLGRDRQLGFGGAGPIPWSAIDRYAERFGIDDPDDFTRFSDLIMAMDGAYMRYQAEAAEREKKAAKVKAKGRAG